MFRDSNQVEVARDRMPEAMSGSELGDLEAAALVRRPIGQMAVRRIGDLRRLLVHQIDVSVQT